jgi:hypothetical protein
VRVLARSIHATQITRFRVMPRVKVGSQVVDQIGGTARNCHRSVDYVVRPAADADALRIAPATSGVSGR